MRTYRELIELAMLNKWLYSDLVCIYVKSVLRAMLSRRAVSSSWHISYEKDILCHLRIDTRLGTYIYDIEQEEIVWRIGGSMEEGHIVLNECEDILKMEVFDAENVDKGIRFLTDAHLFLLGSLDNKKEVGEG